MTSVPSDAPDDYAALRDVKNKPVSDSTPINNNILKQQITEIIYEKLLDRTISKNPIAVRLNLLLFVNACLLFCFHSIWWPIPML